MKSKVSMSWKGSYLISSQDCVLPISTMTPNNRRKPFQGKQHHKDLREFKNQEIKRSLVHRARLRKNYFKLLEKEGVSGYTALPEEDIAAQNERHQEEGYPSDFEEPHSDIENGTIDSNHSKSSQIIVQRSDPLLSQSTARKIAEIEEQKKPMNFSERARLVRERKEQKRQDQLNKVREKREMIQQSKQLREKKRESLSQRNKRGQPVMGPRINDLLEKIRKNN